MLLSDKIKSVIRDVPDFPKPGIIFKDITPLLSTPGLVREIVNRLAEEFNLYQADAIVGIESRGFIFGSLLAHALNLPFIPVRKSGRLPYQKISQSYDLEYGQAVIEIHNDALKFGAKIIIHDDLLATGGTAAAAAKLVQQLGGEVAAFSFLVNLSFLKGEEMLINQVGVKPHYLVNY